ncbi:hypothetical protein FH972_023111 [Carpinus fangiana]|uniref:Uncharacterized protein n=1 Tax=Carpinus fangiana TaxID=176857 RepID=A0A5N6KU82_9ROSI|nr:hypothetical protein FH972_023111 [Carpinus fangiana]
MPYSRRAKAFFFLLRNLLLAGLLYACILGIANLIRTRTTRTTHEITNEQLFQETPAILDSNDTDPKLIESSRKGFKMLAEGTNGAPSACPLWPIVSITLLSARATIPLSPQSGNVRALKTLAWPSISTPTTKTTQQTPIQTQNTLDVLQNTLEERVPVPLFHSTPIGMVPRLGVWNSSSRLTCTRKISPAPAFTFGWMRTKARIWSKEH